MCCGVYGQSGVRALTAAAAAVPSGESVAELESARSENVKVESDGAGSLCGRTAACSSGIKKYIYLHAAGVPTQQELELCLDFLFPGNITPLNNILIIFTVFFLAHLAGN